MLGISYLGKHSYRDFGVMLAPGKEIGNPDKEKKIVRVPFSNVDYDFSEIYGSQTYTNRNLTYPINIWDKTKQRMSTKKTKIVNWLMNSEGKQRLHDDAYPGYYFLAEVEGQASFQENYETGVLTVTFTAYPFMISELEEGHDIWDKFNFELDVSQPVDFTVNGSLDITLLNVSSTDVTPQITASSSMEIAKGDTTYNVPSGESKSLDFALNMGENNMTINGNGTISFLFYKELI